MIVREAIVILQLGSEVYIAADIVRKFHYNFFVSSEIINIKMNMVAKRARTRRWNTSKKKRESAQWSSLPLDLMEKIMRCLFYTDHIRLRAVCKDWCSMYEVSPLKQLPLLMAFNEDSWSTCKLFDPLYKKTYTISIDDTHLKGKSFNSIQVHACKNGWFLLSHSDDPTYKQLFLFSPFCNDRIIDLPRLDSNFQIATFSTNPTDPDCVFFVLSSQPSSSMVKISICRCNDKTWIDINKVLWCSSSLACFVNVVYMEGTFYCSTTSGTVIAYTLAQQKLRVPVHELLGGISETYLVSCDGEILLIGLYSYNNTSLNAPHQQIFKLDISNLSWTRIRSLGDRVLFLGGSDACLPGKRAGRKLEGKFVNRIYYCRGIITKYFSADPSPSRNTRSYPCSRYYGSLAKENCKKIWIEAP
ncbi:hypothetical protein IFM89_024330 [Coptis chinensis]|uniref:F-box domain-containing protein n=1 Tax=Coptis chinensis TaxID=261450 RepID=A0A835IZL7_9MAGN|nr:hypothetical protein IFM89_024330 [Coptis chinensis]